MLGRFGAGRDERRLDLYRSSDNVLMATSVVRKALNVPGHAKAVLMECERLLRRWT